MENFNKKQLDNNGIVLATGLRISKNNNTLKCFMLFFAVLLYSNATVAQWKSTDQGNSINNTVPSSDKEKNGNVGIGTYTPQATLEVARGKAAGGTALFRGTKRDSHFNWNITEDTYIRGGKDFSNVIINDTGGNVGIGTGTPSERLSVGGGAVRIGERTGQKNQLLLGDLELVKIEEYRGSLGASNDTDQLQIYGLKGIFLMGGNVGIGTDSPGLYKLAVEGKIGAREVEVKTGSWADFVFKKNYNLKSLEEVESYIDSNNHLPDVPSEAEVVKNGINLGNMDAVLLQKIEELTLYLIEQNKQIDSLKKEMETLKN